MTIKEFIEKAIEGGWIKKCVCDYSKGSCGLCYDIYTAIFLDPKSWEAVGKVEGWGKCTMFANGITKEELLKLITKCGHPEREDVEKILRLPEQDKWKYKMNGLISHLQDGETIESYIKTL